MSIEVLDMILCGDKEIVKERKYTIKGKVPEFCSSVVGHGHKASRAQTDRVINV
jgi:hypothetical protein